MTTFYKVADNDWYTQGGKEIFERLEDAIEKAQQIAKKYENDYFCRNRSMVTITKFTVEKTETVETTGTMVVWYS